MRVTMIISTGIDIIEISRVEEVLERRGPRFLRKVFTEGEISYCESRIARASSYAVRFAAKEAVMKALGTGWSGGVGFKDVEVIRDSDGAPSIRLHGRASARFHELGALAVHISLSHSRDLAIAQAVVER